MIYNVNELSKASPLKKLDVLCYYPSLFSLHRIEGCLANNLSTKLFTKISGTFLQRREQPEHCKDGLQIRDGYLIYSHSSSFQLQHQILQDIYSRDIPYEFCNYLPLGGRSARRHGD